MILRTFKKISVNIFHSNFWLFKLFRNITRNFEISSLKKLEKDKFLVLVDFLVFKEISTKLSAVNSIKKHFTKFTISLK